MGFVKMPKIDAKNTTKRRKTSVALQTADEGGGNGSSMASVEGSQLLTKLFQGRASGIERLASANDGWEMTRYRASTRLYIPKAANPAATAM